MHLEAAALLFAMTACSGNEWPKTECATPLVIGFGGMTDLEKPLPAVAVGGSADVVPRCASTGNEVLGLDFPYEVATTGKAITAARVDPYVELTGVADGAVTLRIIHGDQVYASYSVTAHVVDAIAIAPAEHEYAPLDHPWVWAPGTHDFVLAPSGAGQPLVDTHAAASFTSLTTGTQGFELAVPAAGSYSLGAHAGTLDTTLAFTVSGTADSITAPAAPAQLDHLNSSSICFVAFDHGAEILGLPWTFTIAGAPATGDQGCVAVTTSASDVGKTIDITGAAAGQALTLTLPVI